MKIRDLEKRRDTLAHSARSILTTAETEKVTDADGHTEVGRDLTAEEAARFDEIMEQVDDLDSQIERERKLREIERRQAARDDDDTRDDDLPGQGDDEPTEEEARSRAFNRYLRDGAAQLSPEDQRALQITPDSEGGYLVAPQEFVNELIKFVDDMVIIRQFATVQQLTMAESLGVPSLETDVDDADWTTELGTGSEDSSMAFGKREFRPHPMAKRIKVSRTLLRKGSMNPETIVRDRLGYKFGVTAEKAYMTGDGNQRPLGLFTASPHGISTSRDAAIGAGGAIPLTTATSDQLIDAKYTLKEQYWRRARWIFHRDILKSIRKLKDGDGNYLWVPGLAGGRPDMILEMPFSSSEFAPNTVTGDAYVGLIGDLSNYWIVDTLALEIQRLVELYAETNQVGFIGRYEGDGMPVLEEAFVRLQVAS